MNEKGAIGSELKEGSQQKEALLEVLGSINSPECNAKRGGNDPWKKQMKPRLAEEVLFFRKGQIQGKQHFLFVC